MIKLKSDLQTRPRRQRSRWLLLLLAALPLAGLIEERWRGQSALHTWKQDMSAQGEAFDPAQLWPPVSAKSVEFSKRLPQVIKDFPERLQAYSENLYSILLDETGNARRVSQEICPPANRLTASGNPTNTWHGLDDLLQQSQPALHQLRELMKDPPAGADYDVAKYLGDVMPNFVAHRIAAQTLHTSALNQLHKGDLEGASQDLQALLSFGKLGEQDPSLVRFMIRMAIIGMSVDVCWDALQADGWTEPQLAELQSHCLDITNVLSQLPRTLEAERIARVHAMDRFRSDTYPEWVARYENLYAQSGLQPVRDNADWWVSVQRHWLFHSLWSFAWADQEELRYLQDLQPEIEALRGVPRRQSYVWLRDQITPIHQNYRAPKVIWRFYTTLPLREDMGEISNGKAHYTARLPASGYLYADFSRAWYTTMKNLTLHELATTAMALKRYELKNSKPPSDLGALAPEFLPALPRDLMDGQPLRYRLEANGAYTLYSIGEDAHDDGGSMVPDSHNPGVGHSNAWSGKDWVWPHIVAVASGPSNAKNVLLNGGE